MNTLAPALSRMQGREGPAKREGEGNETPPDRVILLHGLSRTRRSMARMAAALRREGYHVINHGYSSRRYGFTELMAQFRAFCAGLDPAPRTHFVGHSLGGLILRAALCETPPFPCGRLVLLGVPNRGALSVRRLQAKGWTRALPGLLGRCARELYRDAPWLASIGRPPLETGVIVGTRRFDPLNPSAWINRLHGATEDSDGTVECDSARLEGATAILTLDVGHTFMPADDGVIAAVIRFLREGRF